MSLRTSLCPFPQKEQDRLPWWWLSFLLMSPPLHASVRGQREGRQPPFRAHVVPQSESIDVRPVTLEMRRRHVAAGVAVCVTRVLGTAGAPGRAHGRRPGGGCADTAARGRRRSASRPAPTLFPEEVSSL